MKKIYIVSLQYLAVVTACFLTLVWSIDLLKLDFTIPFGYKEGDHLFMVMLVKGIVENGWVYQNSYLGMPFGQNFYDFPLTDGYLYTIIKIFSLFSSDYAVAMNSYYIAGFFLTSLTCFYVLRQFKISFMPALVASLLYAFIPYHFIRGLGHFFLGIYFMIPLSVMVVLWIFYRTDFLFSFNKNTKQIYFNFSSKIFWISVLICFCLGGSGVYYAFFSCFFLFVAGCFSLFSNKKYNFFNSVVLISVIICGILLNAMPSIIYQFVHGSNLVSRHPSSSELYGLKITQLLLPIGWHRIASLSKFTSYYNTTAPLINENASSALGVVGSIGFLFLLCWIIFFRNFFISEIIEYLSVVNLSAILLATVGGFSSLFSYITHFQIRCYNRISIFIAFFSFLSIAFLLEAWREKWQHSNIKRCFFYISIIMILGIGLLDQSPPIMKPYYSYLPIPNKEQYLHDREFVENIENKLPAGSRIFQLPYIPFPENPKVHKLASYEHLKGYLHSKKLRWSYGAPRGRESDSWQKQVSALHPAEFLNEIVKAGFGGLWIDRFGYVDNGEDIIKRFSILLQSQPIESLNKRYAVWDISNYSVAIQPVFEKKR